jgi:hypothetical protein
MGEREVKKKPEYIVTCTCGKEVPYPEPFIKCEPKAIDKGYGLVSISFVHKKKRISHFMTTTIFYAWFGLRLEKGKEYQYTPKKGVWEKEG